MMRIHYIGKTEPMNDDLHTQLAERLLEQRKMGYEDLIPFLSQAKLPDGFPLPFGQFEVFSHDWIVGG